MAGMFHPRVRLKARAAPAYTDAELAFYISKTQREQKQQRAIKAVDCCGSVADDATNQGGNSPCALRINETARVSWLKQRRQPAP